MTGRNDLTARYLEAAAGQVPDNQREGLRRELAERIADTVDAKESAGISAADAEYETLTELGHPGRLAADYVDRPLQLIGPRYYLLWRMLMRTVVPIAAAFSAFGAAIGAGVDGGAGTAVSFGHILAEGIRTGLQVAVYVAAGVTAVLAIMERRIPAEELDPDLGWKPEQLPEIPRKGVRALRRDLIGDLVGLGIAGMFVLLIGPYSYVSEKGGRVPLLDADTWSWLKWALLTIIAAELLLTIAAMAQGRWTWAHAGTRLALDAATIAVLVPPLANGRLFDPAALTAAGWADGPQQLGPGGTLTTVFVVTVLAICIGDAISGFVRAARQARS
jgi:hypothetical protein